MCHQKGADDNRYMAEEPRAWKARTRGFEAEVDGAIRPSTVTGRCCAVGFVRIGGSHKRNSRCSLVSSSLCTTSVSEGRRCLVHSLSCWSHKTLESNKSVRCNRRLFWHAKGSPTPMSGAVALPAVLFGCAP